MKKYIRYIFSLLCCIALFACILLTASAHTGKTDSSGGHYDHSTGEYHYHHGYPAHSHYDVDNDGFVDCPYDFDDQTDHGSGSHTSGSSSYQYTYPDVPVYATIPFEKSGASLAQSGSKQVTSTETVKQEKNMLIETIGSFFTLFVSLLPVAYFGSIGVIFLKFILEPIVYYTVGLLFKKNVSSRENFSDVFSTIISILLLLCGAIPLLIDYLMVSNANLIAFVILIAISLIFLFFIIRNTDDNLKKLTQERNGLDRELSELRKQYHTVCKEMEESKRLNSVNSAMLAERLSLANEQSSAVNIELYNTKQVNYELQQENEKLRETITRLQVLNKIASNETDNHNQIHIHYLQKIRQLEGENTALKSKVERLTAVANTSVPTGISFAKDGMPIMWKPDPNKPYGDYTVYRSPKSKVYHIDKYCAGYAAQKDHIFNVITTCRACQKCAHNYFNFSEVPAWYVNKRDKK